ncbi:putative RNA-binding protein EIF1AD isoform X1 [Bombus vancouverensis nearcticus]|uniref:Probable RNA-binding protein EIF1AD n=2 Tax=Bombus bifarius TaxID=103933 RepID=A0A6P8M1Z5_9HYME|nr:probable RNA-binding protein EIF1AD isoform X1 [Bombus vancouverensis nearcticus]XP_033301728.1 probable RNA-binding protein EIF1AD isoform X1 [Bombus bifarius]
MNIDIKFLLGLILQVKMSKATKRKHVTNEIQDLTIPTKTQSIVRIIQSRGNNLHEVADPAGSQYLVSMPVKFRRNIWIKRGDFVLVEPISEGNKVKAEIVKILTREHKKWYRQLNCWPKEFDEVSNSNQEITDGENDNEEDDLFVNTNRLLHNSNRIDKISDTSSDESDSC